MEAISLTFSNVLLISNDDTRDSFIRLRHFCISGAKRTNRLDTVDKKIYPILLTCRNKSRNFGEPNFIWRAAFLSLIFCAMVVMINLFNKLQLFYLQQKSTICYFSFGVHKFDWKYRSVYNIIICQNFDSPLNQKKK